VQGNGGEPHQNTDSGAREHESPIAHVLFLEHGSGQGCGTTRPIPVASEDVESELSRLDRAGSPKSQPRRRDRTTRAFPLMTPRPRDEANSRI
jgi:hypothetical protein